jgi:hypothetical protein
MAKRAQAVGASFFSAQPLFLKPSSKGVYLAFISEHFPALEPTYRQPFDSNAFVSQAYRKRIQSMVYTVCAKYALDRRNGNAPFSTRGETLLEHTFNSTGLEQWKAVVWREREAGVGRQGELGTSFSNDGEDLITIFSPSPWRSMFDGCTKYVIRKFAECNRLLISPR